MKKNVLYLLLICILACGSCRDEGDVISSEKGKVSFSINAATVATGEGRSLVEAGPAAIAFEAVRTDGKVFTDTLGVSAHEGTYFSAPCYLPAGEYTLHKFLVLDKIHKIIFMTPLEGSSFASYVPQPLPLSFSVGADEVNEVLLFVLSVEGSTPEDFGYGSYAFTPLELRSLPVLASRLHEVSTGEFDFTVTVEAQDSTTGSLVWTKSYALTSPEVIKVPIGYDQYKVTASADGYIPQTKFYRGDFFFSDLATIGSLSFELIPADAKEVIVLEKDGFKFYISSDPCRLWGRVEMPEEYVFDLDYIQYYAIGRDSGGNYAGSLYPGGGLIGYPALMTNFNNIYDWQTDSYSDAPGYCEEYLDEAYRDHLDLVTFEKGLLLDFDYSGSKSAAETYDISFIHTY